MDRRRTERTGQPGQTLFARVLQQERAAALWISVLAVLAIFSDIAWQSAVPLLSGWDLLLQLGMGAVFLGVLAWHLVDPNSHVQRSLVAILTAAAVGELGRLYVALFGAAWDNPADLALPTAMGYLPLLLLAAFAFMPARSAMWCGGVLLLAIVLPSMVYLLAHLESLASSPRLIDLMHLTLLQVPLTFLMGRLIVRVHLQNNLHHGIENRVDQAGIQETDRTTMSFNRRGLERVLVESIQTAKLRHTELTLGFLDFAHGLTAEQLDEQLRLATQCLRDVLSDQELIVGRWSERRLLLLFPGQTVALTSVPCMTLLETLIEKNSDFDQRIASMSLAAYHPGESTARLIKRADDQLELARQGGGLGLAFSGEDVY